MINIESKVPASVIDLASRVLNMEAGELLISQLTGDASTRVYYRLQQLSLLDNGSSTASVIAAIYGEPFDENERAVDRLARASRLTFANDPCAHLEVTTLLLESGLPVPRTLAVSGPDATVLIQDVGDTRLQDWLPSHSPQEIMDAYVLAIELIVRIQDATSKAVESDSICSHLAFDEVKLKWELDFFFDNYFGKYLGLRPGPSLVESIGDEFNLLSYQLSNRPRVLTHRDYHARNLMMQDGEMYIIDHQDARLGPASYDLASLLADPYVTHDSGTVASLVDRFIEISQSSSNPVKNVAEFRRELDMMTVQRTLKAVGTYSYQAAVRKNLVYVDYIAPALDSALKSIRALNQFVNLGGLLEKTRNQAPAMPKQ